MVPQFNYKRKLPHQKLQKCHLQMGQGWQHFRHPRQWKMQPIQHLYKRNAQWCTFLMFSRIVHVPRLRPSQGHLQFPSFIVHTASQTSS